MNLTHILIQCRFTKLDLEKFLRKRDTTILLTLPCLSRPVCGLIRMKPARQATEITFNRGWFQLSQAHDNYAFLMQGFSGASLIRIVLIYKKPTKTKRRTQRSSEWVTTTDTECTTLRYGFGTPAGWHIAFHIALNDKAQSLSVFIEHWYFVKLTSHLNI